MSRRPLWVVFACIFLASSCRSNKRDVRDLRSQPSSLDGTSAVAPSTSPTTGDQAKKEADIYGRAIKEKLFDISIKKSNLDKEFIFEATLTIQIPAPEFQSLASRIVSFKRKGDSVYLMESELHESVAPSAASDIILAQFAIESESETDLGIDFNGGMTRLLTDGPVAWSGRAGSEESISRQAIKIAESFLSSVETSEQFDRYQIQQVGLLESIDPLTGVDVATPVEVSYSLELYKPDRAYTPVPEYAQRYRRFFETPPKKRVGGGDPVIFSARFDLERGKKKIFFVLSENTPPEYVPAIEAGILYWNRAFGGDVIEVIKSTGKNAKAVADYNLVQWVDWVNAPYAYADMSLDPRSGKIRRAKVFLTSAFARPNFAREQLETFEMEKRAEDSFRAEMKSLTLGKESSMNNREMVRHKLAAYMEDIKARTPGMRGQEILRSGLMARVNSTAYCGLRYGNSLETGSALFPGAAKLTAEAMKKVAADILTAVVAHEVGHTLGLRHNFAGSQAADFDFASYDDILKNYLTSGKIPAVKFTSSVMDYLPLREMALLGASIRTPGKALTYDATTIKFLYADKGAMLHESDLFCTDEDLRTYVDCKAFDSGSSLFAAQKWEEENLRKSLPNLLAAIYTAARFPSKEYKPIAIPDVSLSPDVFARTILYSRMRMFDLLDDNAQYLAVRRRFGNVTDLNLEDVRREERAWVSAQLAKIDIADLLGGVPPEEAKESVGRFTEALKQETGNAAAFSQAEVGLMLRTVNKFFERLPAAYNTWAYLHTAGGGDLVNVPKVNGDLPKVLASHALEIVLGRKAEALQGVYAESRANVNLPIFKYDYHLRTMAASGFTHKVIGNAAWGMKEDRKFKSKVFNALNDAAFNIENAFENDGLDLRLKSFSDWTNAASQEEAKVHNWIIENQALANFVGPLGSDGFLDTLPADGSADGLSDDSSDSPQ